MSIQFTYFLFFSLYLLEVKQTHYKLGIKKRHNTKHLFTGVLSEKSKVYNCLCSCIRFVVLS